MKITLFCFGFLCSVATAFQPRMLPGVSKPLGFFDPLGFSKDKTEAEFKKLQENEIKHARIAMLASLGLLIQDRIHPLVDGEMSRSMYHWQIINGLHPELLTGIVAAISAAELLSIPKSWQGSSKNGIADLKEDYVPGTLGFNLINDDNVLKDLQTKELNNGRLAMIATPIIILQQYLDTHP